ncbi:hypothetical protein TPR58_07135 [Sphingomonas sp. HF-S3]|jgi:hypothetical protein|uniref:Lipoprotein n=1 Tax=Sphingomonas rustica TaxID=3103142 RepID=A0ABV0BA08_9SPHN
MRFILLVSALALAGCGSSEETTTIAGTTYSSNDKEGTASIKSSDGEVSVVDGAAANKVEMPAFAPRYPGSTITGVIETKKAGHVSTMVNLRSADAPAAVATFYRDSFTKNGMKMTSDLPAEEGAMLTAEGKGNKVTVVVSQEDGSTLATISHSAL